MEELLNKDDFLKLVSGLKHTSILYNKNNTVILQVFSFDDCNTLFAKCSKWCIANSKHHWDDYVENQLFNSQFFIISFNDDVEDNLSLIGFTTSISKVLVKIVAAHAKNDRNLLREREFKRILQSMGIDTVVKKILYREWFIYTGFLSATLLTLSGIVYGFVRVCKMLL